MRLNVHSLLQIKPVCAESFDVRNEFHLVAIIFFGMFNQPIKQFAAVTFRRFSQQGLQFRDTCRPTAIRRF